MFSRVGDTIVLSDGIEIPVEAVVEAAIILTIGVLVIVTNVIIIATFITTSGK